MKKSYLATVAAAGLLAIGAAQAQSPGSMEKKDQPGASSGTSSAPPAAPSTTQQRQPSGAATPNRDQTIGQSPSPKAPSTEMKGGTDTKSGIETKSGTSAQSPDTKSGTTAQSPSAPSPKSGTTAQQPDTKSGAATTGQAASGSINLTTQQKTEIRQKVLVSAPRVQNVNFTLNVGTVVPRTVTLAAVPETLVVINPRWRGYRYFVVAEEIIIVEPDTLRIVAVLTV